MNCLVCAGLMPFFMSKDFRGAFGLRTVVYRRCMDCGFVGSETHAEMTQQEWERLNLRVHAEMTGDDPRWQTRIYTQAAVLNDLDRGGIIPGPRWVDYGCGDGALSAELRRMPLHLDLLKYDKYLPREGNLTDAEIARGAFDMVVSTSVLEHLRRRDELEAMNVLLRADGVFAFHTIVCEEIPREPDWFYLSPVHCSFFTNRSMEILFRQWGYVSSLYNVPARLWAWFHEGLGSLEHLRMTGYEVKDGFCDYWKTDGRRPA